jgi:serine/threonine protein kinase
MSAELDRFRQTLADQLSSIDDRLDGQADDLQLLAELQTGIGRLLGTGGGNEAEIRRVLQDRYDSGELRKETFQLVKSMLDRFVTDTGNPDSGTVDKTQVIDRTPSTADKTQVINREPVVADKTQVIDRPPATADKTLVLDRDSEIDFLVEDAADGDDKMSSTIVLPAAETIGPDDADGRVQVGSVLRDRFMLQERVSGGSMGVVYKALDRRLAEAATGEPWVAVKILAPQLSRNGKALRALQQEAAKGRCLIHPNIVRFVDLDRDDDLYFIVMEWLEGRTLADILDSQDAKSIDTARAFEIVRQVGAALDYAHRCGIVHADVKPGNIMITPDGSAKLFDFGVARVRQQQLGKDEFDPGVLGLMTPAYSSMQVLTGETPVPADDVFSLACLLYRLVAGYRVFGPRNAAEAAEEGMQPQRLEALDEMQWRAVKKALSYARVTRFQAMAEFIGALGERSEMPETFTVDVPAPARFLETARKRSKTPWLIVLLVVLGLAAVAANRFGLLDDLKARYLPRDAAAPVVDAPAETVPQEELLPAEEEPQAAAVDAEPIEEVVVESKANAGIADIADSIDIPEPEKIAPPLVDFSKLPPPTREIHLQPDGSPAPPVTLTLREDGNPAIVDLVRDDVEFPLTLRVEEIGFSGNRSPWVTGQYRFSDNGFIEFPVGQNRARITLTMSSDPLREADQQSMLRVRGVDTPGTELATINVILEDDDQRAFEATLPPNTVAFATSQVSVSEADPAVQLEVIRFNPDQTPLSVGFVLRDITATRGQDYFAPSKETIEFGPGQRSTRLLIPLVQDTVYEDNEAFSVELTVDDSAASKDVFRRVAVMIRDDDQ